MGKPPLRFRSLFATVLACSLIAPASAETPLRPYSVYVNGTAAAAISGFSDGAHIVVSLENFAHAIGYRLTRTGPSRLLHMNGDTYAFAPGDPDVLLNGDPIAQTAVLPLERDRMLFVSLPDLQAILSADIRVAGTRIDIATAQVPTDVHTVPLTRPRLSTYTVTSDSGSGPASKPPGARQHFSTDATNALIIHAGTSDYGGSKTRDLSLSTDGSRVRGSLDLSAFDNSSPMLSGQVTVGTRERYVQAGYESNPFNGLIFSAPGGTGASIRRDNLTYGSEHDSLGRTLLGVRRDTDDGAIFYGAIREHGGITPVLGIRTSLDGKVKVTREFWMTDRGTAASIDLATQGRIFGEAVVSGTLGTLPLTSGEAPERLNIGYRANRFITLRAGATSGYEQRASPYFSLSIFGNRSLTGSIQLAGGNRNLNLDYAGQHASLSTSYSTSADGGATWGFSGSLSQRGRLWDVSAFHSATNEDDVIRTHTTGGPAFILGAERLVSSGRSHFGPVVGITMPIGTAMAFEVTDHPTGTGRAIGFGFSRRISFAPRVHLRNIRLQNASPAELFVDDHLVQRIDAGFTSVSIAPGAHRIQARTADGQHASLPVMVGDSNPIVDVALLPVRAVAGRIVQSDADPAGRKISLEHVQVILEPGDIAAETLADGTFVFPPVPLAENARISIVKDSLPDDLTVGDDAPAASVPLVLSVKTKVKVHRKKF